MSMVNPTSARTTVRAVLKMPGSPMLKFPKMPRPVGAVGAGAA